MQPGEIHLARFPVALETAYALARLRFVVFRRAGPRATGLRAGAAFRSAGMAACRPVGSTFCVGGVS